MSTGGIKGLFNKKKQKASAAKEPKAEKDDGEWLASAPNKTSTVRVVTSGKIADDYRPEVEEVIYVDPRTQMEIEETKRMLSEAQKRKEDADVAEATAKLTPTPAAASSRSGGLLEFDWRAKNEERRLKELEKNKEEDFPSLVADKPKKAEPTATKAPTEKRPETVFSAVAAVPVVEEAVQETPTPVVETPVIVADVAQAAAVTEEVVTAVAEGVSDVKIDEAVAAKKKKKKASYMDF